MLTFHTLSPEAYADQRYDLIYNLEGAESEIYADSVGIATIGIGFNLAVEDILREVLGVIAPSILADETLVQELLAVTQVNYGSGNDGAARAAINGKMAEFHAVNPDIPPTLQFDTGTAGKAQMKDAFLLAVPSYEDRVDSWYGSIVPDSAERIVLLSLAYGGLLTKSPSLRAAIQNGDRAEAWYEIAYNSNGGDSRSPGIANRRYAEAETFGLYNDEGNISLEEATQVLQMYTKYKAKILSEEKSFPPPADGEHNTVTGLEGIRANLQPAIQVIADSLGIVSTRNLEDYEMLVDYLPEGSGGEEGTEFLKGDSEHDNEQSTHDIILGEAGRDSLYGGVGDDILFGGAGNDKLYGEGGDDVLLGGTESDTLRGGEGADEYRFFAGDGVDHIYDSGEGDRIFIDDIQVSAGGGTFRIDYTAGKIWWNYDYEIIISSGNLTIRGNGLTVNIHGWSQGDYGFSPHIHYEGFPKHIPRPLPEKNGSSGDDILRGTKSDELINGKGGDDTLYSGGGNDVLIGGNGFDTYVLSVLGGKFVRIIDEDGNGIIIITDDIGRLLFPITGDAVQVPGSGAQTFSAFAFQALASEGTKHYYTIALHDIRLEYDTATEELVITGWEGSGAGDGIRIEGFHNGDFGIRLVDAPQNAAPVVEGFDAAAEYALLGGAVAVDTTLTLSDDGGMLHAATVTLNGKVDAGEVLSVDTGGTGITASYDPLAGVLSLSGVASAADYETVLETLRYDNPTHGIPTAGTRSLELVVHDGELDSAPVTLTLDVVFHPTVTGTDRNDTINGLHEQDLIDARAGDDTVKGKQGDDFILAGGGGDHVHGNRGNDTISGGDGDDALFGDKEDDYLDGGDGNDALAGGSGNDTLIGGNGDDILRGGGGADVFDGGAGNDDLAGGREADLMQGSSGNDTLRGGDGEDSLLGGAGDDVVYGGKDSDIITGGAGADVLYGRGGGDTFRFTSLADSTDAAQDTIMDFKPGDRIDLSGLGFTGIAQGTGSGSTLGWTLVDRKTIELHDADSDLSLLIHGVKSLSDTDFSF